MIEITPNLIVDDLTPLEVEIPWLKPLLVMLSVPLIILLGHHDVRAMRAYHD